MAGAIIIVVVLLMIPVIVLMSGGIASGILGQALERDAEARHEGSELLDIDDELAVHRRNEAMAALTQAIVRYATERVRLDPPPLDGPRTLAELRADAGTTITPEGIGGLEALRIFGEVLAPACISVDHPRFLSFVPAAPTEAAILFDLVVGASSIYGGSWLEGGGAVFAENEALRWIADLAGMPAGGRRCVRQRGHRGQPQRSRRRPLAVALARGGAHDRTRGLLLASSGAHSSVVQAARVMDADVAERPGRRLRPAQPRRAPVDGRRPRPRRPRPALRHRRHERDDERRRHRRPRGCRRRWPLSWARGSTSTAPTAAPPSPRRACASASTASRPPTASSSIRTSGCSPRSTRAPCCTATRRSAAMPTPSTPSTSTSSTGTDDEYEWNASDYAHHLTRRARGLPLWFSLATHGTQAYTDAIETHAARHPRGRRAGPLGAAPRADPRARAVRGAVPPHRLGCRRLQGVERPATGDAAVVRHADGVAGRDRAAVVHRQPADDGRRPRRDRRQPGRRPPRG